PAGVDRHWGKRAVGFSQPRLVLQVHAGTDVVRNDGDPLAEAQGPIARRNVDLAVLLAQPHDLRCGMLDDVAMTRIGEADVAIARQRLRAGVDHRLALYRGAD